ncbi:MAG TPA: tripartite tricarboxylate transporter substrate-binding protein [Bradyrhizobium sp.]|uniref:tripartite tricarboxylate transporter substrate-binding protein n=1 Tax=Bradyrhizobium sp. TaxID=376 RepID=UPI002C9B12DB|nr:tripartite tricarboxylate transporter substrate-binding protein [Bradyrhizobium sp.]HTB00275.1 tripartite tricarboxylate transporter substrate-binding protein [Bradyrhizobium sp.]
MKIRAIRRFPLLLQPVDAKLQQKRFGCLLNSAGSGRGRSRGRQACYWQAIWAPKNTPADVVAKLNAAIVAALADRGVQARFLELGQETPPPDRQTPAALKSHQTAEIEKWWPIVKAASIRAE